MYSTSLKGLKRNLVLAPFKAERLALHTLRDQRAHHGELLQAYLDLRLVANPGPLEAADQVLTAHGAVMDLGLESSRDAVADAVNSVVARQREFTDVCRDDLWYRPKSWQPYRRGWLAAWRWRRRQRAT
ncbi:hypothetical protein [Streptomyces sp. bgisy027]|uniref:hypothetical protein n=1 Tax=Streptomyces sp. bgisy027 TaxID=3413770 RepID=UPI003D765BFA